MRFLPPPQPSPKSSDAHASLTLKNLGGVSVPAQSEYLQGFVNPAEGSDEFGYGALGSDDEGGGGVDGGAGGGGDGGEEQDPGCEGYTEGIEPQVSEEARSRGARGPSQGSGIERGHVEVSVVASLVRVSGGTAGGSVAWEGR